MKRRWLPFSLLVAVWMALALWAGAALAGGPAEADVATPASPPSTPSVAVENVGANMHPIPTPRTSRPGRTLLA